MAGACDSDVEVLSVEAGVPGIPHPAMLRDRQYFPVIKDCAISLDHVRVVQTTEDGFCAYDSLIRGSRKAYEPESVDKEEMRVLKSRMMEECVGWIIN